MQPIDELKFNLREKTHPYFDDTEIQELLDKHSTTDDDGNTVYNVNESTKDGLLIKSEAKEFRLGDTIIINKSDYWLRLMKNYRTNQGGIVKRADE